MQIEAILKRPTRDSRTSAVFVDYARAFDSFDHGWIMGALQKLGVDEGLRCWIGSFLSNRSAAVRFDNTYPSPVNVPSGAPKGSVLGPILFIEAIGSLSERLNAIPFLHHGFFADDLSILCQHTDRSLIQSTLQSGFGSISKWLGEHFMELSAPKTQYTFFGMRNPSSLYLKVNGIRIKESPNPKVLGVTLQPIKGTSTHMRDVLKPLRMQLAKLGAGASPQ